MDDLKTLGSVYGNSGVQSRRKYLSFPSPSHAFPRDLRRPYPRNHGGDGEAIQDRVPPGQRGTDERPRNGKEGAGPAREGSCERGPPRDSPGLGAAKGSAPPAPSLQPCACRNCSRPASRKAGCRAGPCRAGLTCICPPHAAGCALRSTGGVFGVALRGAASSPAVAVPRPSGAAMCAPLSALLAPPKRNPAPPRLLAFPRRFWPRAGGWQRGGSPRAPSPLWGAPAALCAPPPRPLVGLLRPRKDRAQSNGPEPAPPPRALGSPPLSPKKSPRFVAGGFAM